MKLKMNNNTAVTILIVFLCKLIIFVDLSWQVENSCSSIEWKLSNGDANFQNELKKRLNLAFQKTSGSKKYTLDCKTLNKDDKIIFNLSSPADVTTAEGNANAIITFSSSQKCTPTGTETRRLKVILACEPTIPAGTSQISSVADDQQLCTWTFLLSSKTVCDPYPVASTDQKPAVVDGGAKSSGGSHFGVGAFFLVVFLFICGYFLVGFLYKRYVAGAQGYEQIPHYLFLRRLLRTIQSPMTGTQYHRPSPNDPTYRNYDEGDEFRYDQPPLMPASMPDPSPTGGQNRFSSRPSAKDESDVRLLVV